MKLETPQLETLLGAEVRHNGHTWKLVSLGPGRQLPLLRDKQKEAT